MAEAVVGLLIGKLGAALVNEAANSGASLLCHEVSALQGLFGQIHEAKDELVSMQAYLKGAERVKDTDETTGLFVERIRGFAFEIEDVVDEFTCKLLDKNGGFAAMMKKRMKHVKTWRRLARKLKDINGRLQGAKHMKEHYSMSEIDRNDGGGASHAKSTNQYLHFTRQENLVGMMENKEKLMQWIKGDGLEQKSKIATVWGMPGVGKTTLITHVYNTVKLDFDHAAWVTVSKSYNVQNLLKQIAGDIGITADVMNTEMRNLDEIIYNYLQGKRYILILDDVWAADVWSEIKLAFPHNCMGRFVITSRNKELSLFADSAIHLAPLEAHHSWLLFCNEAFWNVDDKECPSELQKLARKFVKKCDGLPVAIACIGRLLSCKPPTSTEWTKVYNELEQHLVTNVMPRVEMILKVSLEDLPYDLKNCFLHCALLPEDYLIKRRRIVRHWIAAGFIKAKNNKTLEEVGEEYLAELVNRSLLQVVQRNYSGKLKCCRMHDVIRFVALNKAEKECFGKVYDGSREFSLGLTRRISIQSRNLEQLSPSDATHVRALHVFERNIHIDLLRPILTYSSLLSMLDLQGTGALIKALPDEVFTLFNLRYLGLRGTDVASLPEALGRLQNLEVLDAFDTKLSYLPNSIVELQNLRYLYACTEGSEMEFESWGGVKVPRGIRRLTALHSLLRVKGSSEILREVADLKELRTFGISAVRGEHSSALSNAINEMSHLVHLQIAAAGEEEVLQLQGLCLPPTISTLELGGQLEKTTMTQVLSSWSHTNSLTRLQLAFSKIDEESFSSLLLLQGICHLALGKAFEGKKLHFGAGSFRKLRVLQINVAPQLNQVEIEEGAVASLVELNFFACPELKFLPGGIEHLTCLEELILGDTSEELVEKLRQNRGPNECNDEIMKVSHIRKVIVGLTEKGIWERIR